MNILRVVPLRMAFFGVLFLLLWGWGMFGPNEYVEWRWLAIVLGLSACAFAIGEWQSGISAFSILTFAFIAGGFFEPVRVLMSVLVGIGFGLFFVWPQRGKKWSDVYDWQLMKQKSFLQMAVLAVLLFGALFGMQLIGNNEITNQGLFLFSWMGIAALGVGMVFIEILRPPAK